MLLVSSHQDYSVVLNFPDINIKLTAIQGASDAPLVTVVLYNTVTLQWVCPPGLVMTKGGRIHGVDDAIFAEIVHWLYEGMK